MDERQREQIKDNHATIVRDMCNVESVCDALLSSHVLNEASMNTILKSKTREAKARELNLHIPKMGEGAYNKYCNALRHDNETLANLLIPCKSEPPSQPKGPLRISEVTHHSATLKWQTPESDGHSQIKHYDIDVSVDNGNNWEYRASVDCKSTAYTAEALEEGNKYKFRVKAANDIGQGIALDSGSVLTQKTSDDRVVELEELQSLYQAQKGELENLKLMHQAQGTELANLKTQQTEQEDFKRLYEDREKELDDLKALHQVQETKFDELEALYEANLRLEEQMKPHGYKSILEFVEDLEVEISNLVSETEIDEASEDLTPDDDTVPQERSPSLTDDTVPQERSFSQSDDTIPQERSFSQSDDTIPLE